MKTHSEIDLDETPIIVLGCGHFFTAETLDGHMRMADFYMQDENGEFTGLRNVSAVLAPSIPRCPDCQCPVRQYSTHRFNRIINRAVIDEMSKRFLVNGKSELLILERRIKELEQYLEASREKITDVAHQASVRFTGQLTPAKTVEIVEELKDRHYKSKKLQSAIQSFSRRFMDRHQPAQKLHDATVHATKQRHIDHMMSDLDIGGSVPAVARDRRIILGCRVTHLSAECVILLDKINIDRALKPISSSSLTNISEGFSDQLAKSFFETCETFINDCREEALPKLGVEAALYYARVAQSYNSYKYSIKVNVHESSNYMTTAKELLEKARKLCAHPFQNSDILQDAVVEMIRQLQLPWYEEVTAEEIAAIKDAMVSGSGGLATHSGHWYNCVNGHPFAIGECGMAMELARCPECGAPVGGEHHRTVQGVTRAINMED